LPQNKRDQLDVQLLAAHDAGDSGLLVGLYSRAANLEEAESNIDAACFYLTQAYVFGLETSHPDTTELHARLCALGREE